MPWDGPTKSFIRNNGRYTGTTVWGQDFAADEDIDDVGHDAHDQDLAQGITETLNINGLNAMAANLDMNGYRIVGLLDATGAQDAVSKSQLDAVQGQVTTNSDNITSNASNISQNEQDIIAVNVRIDNLDAVSEAPIDGKYYSRFNGAWEEAPGGVTGDDLITNVTWDGQVLTHARVTGGDILTTVRKMTEFVSDGLIRHKISANATGSATIDVAASNRHRVENNGAMTLTFTNVPTTAGSFDDTDLGEGYRQEGQIKIRNGASPGSINISGFTGSRSIGTQSTDGDIDQILTYIIDRYNLGGGVVVELTLVWSN